MRNSRVRALRLIGFGCLLVVVTAATAMARPVEGTTVFPLSSNKPMPPSLAGAPERLTKAVVALTGGTLAESSVTSAALAVGCTIDDSTCLDLLARANRVKEVVFGTIRVGDDRRVSVKLTRYIAGTERRERTFTLNATSAAGLAKQLDIAAREMFGEGDDDGEEREDVAVEVEVAPQPPAPGRAMLGSTQPRGDRELVEEDEPAPVRAKPAKAKAKARPSKTRASSSSDEPARRPGQITTGTYALIGTGLVALAIGGGLQVAAYALHDDVERAPRNTPEDFRALTELERAGRLRAQSGTILLAAGGAAVAAGVIRAVIQRSSSSSSSSSDRGLSLVPSTSGASLVFSTRFR